MRNTVAICCLLACVAVVFAARIPRDDKANTYTTEFDNIDLERILQTKRLLDYQINCLLAADEKRCNREGKTLKQLLPDALVSDCEKCSEKQKEGAKKVILHMRQHRPADWAKLQAKFDPENIYATKHAEELAQLDKELKAKATAAKA